MDELENISSNERRVLIPKNRKISLRAEAPSTKNLQSLLFGLYKAGDETLEADIYHNSYTLWKKTSAMTQLLSLACDSLDKKQKDTAEFSFDKLCLVEKHGNMHNQGW